MLSKRVIMNEWRDFVKLRDANTCIYVDRPAPGPDPGGARPGSPARAPASLTEPYAP
jgi:hypothetical protein